MNCLAFVKALKGHLDVEDANRKQALLEKNSKKKLPPKKTLVTGVVGTRTDGLQLMTTLALTHAHMSRSTVLMLEVRTG